MLQISQVEKITGLTRRQLQYWNKTGLIEPAVTSDAERMIFPIFVSKKRFS